MKPPTRLHRTSSKASAPRRAGGLLLATVLSLTLGRLAVAAPVLSPALTAPGAFGVDGLRSVVILYKEDRAATRAALAAAPTPAAALRQRAQSSRPAPAAGVREGGTDLWLLNGYLKEVTAEELEALAADPRVEAVIENFVVTTPEVRPTALSDSSEEGNWGVEAAGVRQAWELFGVRGRGVRIGHLDTGVDASHPDLAGRLADWAEFDGRGNRVVGSVPHDNGFHGTHTAGTLVGGSAGGGPVGVAPEAQLLSAIVLGASGGTLAQVVAGMQWALDPDGDPTTDDGVRVLSLSLGAPGRFLVFEQVVRTLMDAGVLPVFAIGNGGANTTVAPGNVPGALSVGALSASNGVPYFSGGGRLSGADGRLVMKPEIAAPGAAVRSTLPGGVYGTMSGTSMATPFVAGVAALLLEKSPTLSADRLRALLLETARDVGEPGEDDRSGHGRVDVLAALSRVSGTSLVRGIAQDRSGPVPAVVRVRESVGRAARAVLADELTGSFAFNLAGGHYRIEAVSGASSAVQEVDVVPGQILDLTFDLSAAPEGEVLVYPNPFKPSRGDKAVTFRGPPHGATVSVYALSGALVAELRDPAFGEFVWDGRNASGEDAGSGLYYYVAKSYDVASGWTTQKGKLAVIR
jgi:subtilisin family serine protease